ncbi:MAG: fimbrial assembly protein PilM [Parcubacteria group bacterium GW2011_GWE2_39_37]|uniref:Fimbrial assembly protein PilM n=1 Tax=Candidatus Falkowbacteria bacterium GW2011_GWF2_39_8 TaxID=1618642 RepID=A0A0G0T045_9BACT|nr:MAG: fimbrial assembly protein PilM [Parcubacteria group bacterium GW2011_GWE2_39_37]KKR31182.1 MAG: fimbrial assembly protein PilM [Candidatus Falkowbacteria bacterium GW2011_GWF2_39_8]
MILHNSSNFPIGIDISDLSIKICQINKIGNNVFIQASAKSNLPKGMIEDSRIVKKEELGELIRDLVSNPKIGKFTSTDVAVCLPENKTFVKLITIEKNPNDIAEVIKIEIEKYIPMAIDEMYFDWQIIKTLPQGQLVLIGAAPKAIVDEYSQLFDSTGFTVSAFEIESTAICRALLKEESNKFKDNETGNYGIIDIGEKQTSMIVYAAGTILFTVSMPVSGEMITQKISDTLQIDFAQAEKAKILCGLDKEKASGVVSDIIDEVISDLVARIEDVNKFHMYHYSEYGKINKLLLCGGGSNILDLHHTLKKRLGIEVEIGNTLNNLTGKEIINGSPFSKKIVRLENEPGWATAIGLALRGVFVDEI